MKARNTVDCHDNDSALRMSRGDDNHGRQRMLAAQLISLSYPCFKYDKSYRCPLVFTFVQGETETKVYRKLWVFMICSPGLFRPLESSLFSRRQVVTWSVDS
ncbi:hypothetical protein RRG08_007942 [Elysia crispata]|uniref:Uncharacterized protein n=1 Tax=Elysia crispata TaxID=231223 RepID=A0AAE0ZPZ0_9GAST|nr:hypothetical protein RRG08_007942 [Elysia crispata]